LSQATPQPTGPDSDLLLETARRAAARAAAVQREARGQMDPSRWSEKGRSDFVTEVDIESERVIVETIRERFPDHAFLAEEGSGNPGTVSVGFSMRWIVDPLDGTTNWLHGYPEYAVSIAAEDGEGLRAGVVLNSATGELFEAVRGEGARRDGRPIQVSGLDDLDLALIGTGFPFKKLNVLPAYLETLSRVLRATAGIRRAGAAALDLCDLACGRLDAFWEYWLMPWDVAAGALVVREAGGVFEPLEVSGLDREPERFPQDRMPDGLAPGAFLGANGRLLAEFRTLVAGGLPD
jgi:myo-inositol-1(or 4)-monophosphatase